MNELILINKNPFEPFIAGILYAAYEYNAQTTHTPIDSDIQSYTHTQQRQPSTLCMYGLPVSVQFLLFVLPVSLVTVDFRKNPHCTSTLPVSRTDRSCRSVECRRAALEQFVLMYTLHRVFSV